NILMTVPFNQSFFFNSTEYLRHLLQVVVCILLLAFAYPVFAVNNGSENEGNTAYINKEYSVWSKMNGTSLNNKAARFLEHRNEPDSAMVCYSILASRYDSTSNNKDELGLAIEGMLNVGYIYQYYYYDFQKAYYYLELARATSLRHEITGFLPHIYHNLANLYQMIGQTLYSSDLDTYSLAEYKKAFSAAIETNNPTAAVMSFNTMVHTAVMADKGELLPDVLVGFDSISQDFSHPLWQFSCLHSRMAHAYCENRFSDAVAYLTEMEKAIPDNDTQKDRFRIMALLETAVINAKNGNVDKAIELNDSIIRIATEINAAEVLLDSYEYQSQFYGLKNDSVMMNHFHILHLQKKDSLLNFHKLGRVNKMKFLNDIEHVNSQVRELTQKRHTQSIIIKVICLVTVITGIFLIILIHTNRKIRLNNRLLYNKAMEALRKEEVMKEQTEKFRKKLETFTREEGNQTDNPTKSRYKNSTMSNEKKIALWDTLTDIMRNNEAIYSESFSISMLADLAGSNYKAVSQVINEMFDGNFNKFLNEYRIQEACIRLNDFEKYGMLTIEGIGKSLGFKSRSNFVTTFKKIVGLTPSEFQKIARENKNSVLNHD
ncbi:MAG: AraC family transcriptional regulator, partial [Muribaculaceae bacterium]|nr:AraC family transcriptional regulator [Muribaculaceae bacterium]